MDKQKLKVLFLVLLPIFAVGIACNPGSVLIFEPATEKGTTCSYFALLPEGTFRISTVLAGCLGCLAGGLSITYAVGKKDAVAKGAMYASLASAVLAVVPVLMRGEIMVLPNVGVPILLGIHAAVAYFMTARKEKNEARRLK